MTIKGGVQRSVNVYKLDGREVSAETFVRETGAPIYSTAGDVTALGRDVGAELPKGAKVQILDPKTGEPTRTFYGTGTEADKAREEKESLKPRVKILDTRELGKDYNPIKPSSTEAGRRLQELAGSPYYTPYSNKVADVKGGATKIQKVVTVPYSRTTRTDLAPQPKINVYSPGTIYNIQEDSIPFQGRNIPIYKTYTVGKPNKETGIYEGFSSSISTDKEIKQFNNYIKAERFKEVALQKPRTKVQNVFGEVKGRLQILGSEPFISDETIKKFKEGNKGGKIGGLFAGTVAGFIPRTKGELGVTALTFGIGSVFGAGVKGGSFLLSKVPKAGGYLSSGFKLGTFGTGAVLAGAYALDKVSTVSFQKDYFGKGEIIGSSIRELGALGIGYGVGSKGFTQVKGLIETRGLIEIPLERLTQKEVIEGTRAFPTAKSSTHLKLFKETTTKIPELTQGRAGGFHTTPDKFWKKEIKPKAGSSELPGLYVSAPLSPNFLKLEGSGYFNFPTIKSIISGDNPAIAFLKPKGFREVGFKEVPPYKIDKQTFRFVFKKPALEGFIDIPKMKTEIEGIARIEAGAYSFESRKYYTTVRNVRIPIDVFKTGTKADLIKLKNQPSEYFKSEKYSLPKQESFINPSSLLGKGFKGSSYSSKSSSYISSIISSGSKPSSKVSSKVSMVSSLNSIVSRQSSTVSRQSSTKSLISSFTSYTSKQSSTTSSLRNIFNPPYRHTKSYKFPKLKSSYKRFNIFKDVKQRKFYVSSIVGILSGKAITGAPKKPTSGLGFRLPVKRKRGGISMAKKGKAKKKK